MTFPSGEGPATVDAVNAKVRTWPIATIADTDPAPADWSADEFAGIVLGSVLLAARLFMRRNSPDGVAAFSDGSPAYVARTDPDVALLLQLGTNIAPQVG